jgi:hypothetical protein
MSLWHETARELRRVLPLVLGGAALLLLLLAILAEWRGGAFLLGAMLALPLAALLGVMLAEAWRSGVLPGRPLHTSRAAQPWGFAVGFAMQAASAVGLVGLGLWCLWRLFVPGSEAP